MAISPDDVRKVARLARLALTDDEAESYTEQLSGILEYVSQLDELDLEGVEPAPYPFPLELATRPDTPGNTLDNEAALSNAPARDGGAFAVPAIITPS